VVELENGHVALAAVDARMFPEVREQSLLVHGSDRPSPPKDDDEMLVAVLGVVAPAARSVALAAMRLETVRPLPMPVELRERLDGLAHAATLHHWPSVLAELRELWLRVRLRQR
jgi:hypothetical protein